MWGKRNEELLHEEGYMKSTKLLHAMATTPHLLQQLCPSVWQSHSSAAQSADANWKNLPMAGGWNWVIFKVPPSQNQFFDSMIHSMKFSLNCESGSLGFPPNPLLAGSYCFVIFPMTGNPLWLTSPLPSLVHSHACV